MTAPVLSASDPTAIDRGVAVLRAGGLVGIPTETVYGLAADATNGVAVAGIYAAKKRPSFNPLISHIASIEMAEELVVFTPVARNLAEAFWPGPLTLVLPRTANCPVNELASAGLDTLAVRMPAHPVAQDLIRQFGRPLVAPSANPSGGVSPTTAAHVASGLGDRIDLVLDGGAAKVGLESTVIGFDGEKPVRLRKGGLPRRDIEAITGGLSDARPGAATSSPGMLASHYAPAAAMRLNAQQAKHGEEWLGFGRFAGTRLNLSPAGNLTEAAANLFAYLREIDASGATHIAVAPIPDEGLGEAINDRLNRAAAPRMTD
jgi:L-threonylcarbamoyladenylate synthase